MAAKTYKTRALVLRKTKLGEKDLIVTMLDSSGALVKGVAKGARKPGGSLAARLELFSTVDVLMARGRSLDVVCEARLAAGSPSSLSLEQSACAAPIAELLALIAQPDLVQPRLFDLSHAAIARISASGDRTDEMLSLCAASLWKVMAQTGFRPSFAACALCGSDVTGDMGQSVALSLADGGVVCENCRRPADAIVVGADSIRWCEALIRARFDEVVAYEMKPDAAIEAIQLARLWIRTHTGRDLKSLDFLLVSGLF